MPEPAPEPAETIELPEHLRSRPTYKGFVIPFFALIGADGVPDFKVIDQDAWWACAAERRCGICGEELGYWIVFAGGPRCAEHRLFVDPPMHEECARYASQACPFLARDDFGYARHHKDHGGTTAVIEEVASERPQKMGLMLTRGYKIVERREGLAFQADPFKRIDWL